MLHTAQSYILLTANLEDVHAIAKQLAASPVADQLKRIWRRASKQFNIQLAKANSGYHQRADDAQEVNSAEAEPTQNEAEQTDNGKASEESLMGKNASVYLNSVQKIMEQA